MMKHLTKLLSLMLVLSLILSLSPKVFAEEETALVETVPQETVLEENGFTYTVENGEATVVKGPRGQFETLEIPETLGGYPVTALGDSAFYSVGYDTRTQAVTLVIPDTVHTFGKNCFTNNTEIGSLNIPKSLSSVGTSCFKNTNLSFDSLTLNLTHLGSEAFYGVQINNLVLGEGLTIIGAYAFSNCKIQSLTLPHSVKDIKDYAFYFCLLTDLTIPEGIENIYCSAFAHNAIHTVNLPDSLLYIGSQVFEDNDLQQVTLPKNLEYLSGSAFNGNESLTKLEIPESLIFCAFGSSNDIEITGPADNIAVAFCLINRKPYRDVATGELLPAPETVTEDGIEYKICGEIAVVTSYNHSEMPKDLVIPATVSGKPVMAIWERALSGIPSESVTLPEGITFIGAGALSYCDNLSVAYFPESLQCINQQIFRKSDLLFLYVPSQIKYLVYPQPEPYLGSDPAIILCDPTNKLAEEYRYNTHIVFIEEERQYLLYDQGLYSTADGKTLRLDKMLARKEAYVPDYINEMPVTELLPQAIYSNEAICDVYFGNCITAIPKDIFVRFNPGHIYFPPSVTAIDEMFLSGDRISDFYMVVHEGTYAHHYAIIHDMRSIVIPKMRFTDVKPGSWYYDSVKYVFENGLMQGTSSTRFDPHGTMTRAMLAQVLFNLAGDESSSYPCPFTDVPRDSWYAKAVSWAAWCELVNGVTSTEFKPNDPVTREQMVTIFYRFANALQLDTSGRADLSGYEDDQKISGYATDAFSWAVEAGIINGVTDTKLDPKGLSNRAQVATVIARFMQWFSAQ